LIDEVMAGRFRDATIDRRGIAIRLRGAPERVSTCSDLADEVTEVVDGRERRERDGDRESEKKSSRCSGTSG
jgi:hypothetical protein